MVYKEKDVQQDFCVPLHFLRDIYLPACILTKLRSKISNKLANSVISSSATQNTNCPVSHTTCSVLLLVGLELEGPSKTTTHALYQKLKTLPKAIHD